MIVSITPPIAEKMDPYEIFSSGARRADKQD
jgi:hypothetical protein